MEQRSRSRASTEPIRHYTDGHIVDHGIGNADIEILREFRYRRYHSAPYLAALLGRHPVAMSRALRRLKVKGVDGLQLCELQRTNVKDRTMGFLYYELGSEGYNVLNEEGIKMPEHKEDKQFAHTLCLDQVMASIEIGIRQQTEVTITYREDLPRSLPLSPRDGKRRWMTSDHMPVTLTRNGKPRHIVGIEIETGANRLAKAVTKFKNIRELIKSGTIEKYYGFGKQYFWLFVFRTEATKESAMAELAIVMKDDPELCRHILFKRHPIYGKSHDKPQPTGHMFTESWTRAGFPPLYLNGGEGARQ
ncbi:MAG: hypothetical protein E6Q97_08445 [Desulfurellales bacterium]|nr:MAG: hypothetical protein E6Q97_08445 [Desulfurellales bacterium]